MMSAEHVRQEKRPSRPRVTIGVGTCGFSYADWVGPVYPKGTKSSQMLELYAERFPIVEIDATYYRVPPASTFASMSARTPRHFRFTAKLPGTATHVRVEAAGAVHDDVHTFRRAINPLLEAHKFAAALMQFPTSFHPSEATRDHVAALRGALPDIPLVAEFRHREWQTNETLELLRQLKVGWVNVDEPQFKTMLRPSTDVTSPIAYIRFHGRNYEQWWKGDNTTRFDYLYRPDELEPWVDRLVDIADVPKVREILTFFNNHRRGQAARNAEMFETMIATRFGKGTVLQAEPQAQNAGGEDPTLPLPL
jgi:uncharacterized protein YecE (DUF72 family)